MTNEAEFNLFKCLDFIKQHAGEYAQAKAERIYLENFRKSKKAMLMRDAELAGHKTAAMQEREAYSNPEYVELLAGLQAAVEKEERLRWLLVGAQAQIECWRTVSANQRAEAKNL